MTLRKRYARNLKKNVSFYICTVLLTAFVVLLYLGFDAACVKISEELDAFYRNYHVEDAQFTTLTELDEEDIRELREAYDIRLEKQTYINYQK